MIQIIGFIACFYVFIRGLDIIAQSGEDRLQNTRWARALIGAVACAGAVFFTYLLIEQGNQMPSIPQNY